MYQWTVVDPFLIQTYLFPVLILLVLGIGLSIDGIGIIPIPSTNTIIYSPYLQLHHSYVVQSSNQDPVHFLMDY